MSGPVEYDNIWKQWDHILINHLVHKMSQNSKKIPQSQFPKAQVDIFKMLVQLFSLLSQTKTKKTSKYSHLWSWSQRIFDFFSEAVTQTINHLSK